MSNRAKVKEGKTESTGRGIEVPEAISPVSHASGQHMSTWAWTVTFWSEKKISSSRNDFINIISLNRIVLLLEFTAANHYEQYHQVTEWLLSLSSVLLSYFFVS
jgi:hypothetical protein